MEVETESTQSTDDNNAKLVEDFDMIDADCCSSADINSYFSDRYVEVHSLKVTEGNSSSSALLVDDFKNTVANVLSDKTVVVIDRETFRIKTRFKPHKKDITDIKFSPKTPSLIYTSSLNGKINMWDSRSEKIEKTIVMNTSESKMPLTSFDMSSHEKLICAGTELIGEDTFLLFWDLRGDKLLGGYWESHSDDITHVRFNPVNPEYVASAGLDGLINVFDVSKSAEDSALTYCLNTKDIAQSFTWRTVNKKFGILAFTDVFSVQLWDIEEGSPSHSFSREKLTKALQRSVTYECYPVSMCYASLSVNPLILAGSGLEHKENNCLRTLRIDEKHGYLEPHGLLVGKSRESFSSITQAASLNENFGELVTVRENGIMSLWNSTSTTTITNKNKFKVVKKRKNVNQPY